MAYAGTHSWEIFEHVPNREMGWMPAKVVEGLRAGLDRGGEPATPLVSATVVPLRVVDGGLRAWLMRRRTGMKFGGLWAFPGGKLEPDDEAAPDPLRTCAVRELAEETGCSADPGALLPWSRWITPEPLAYRFDAWTFLWPVPDGVELVAGEAEALEGRWFTPGEVLDSRRDDTVDPDLMPPTRSVLCELALLGSLDRVREAAAAREVAPVTPRFAVDADGGPRFGYPLRSGEWQ